MSDPVPVPPPDPITAALSYAAHGFRVLPIKPGEKYPPMTEWQNAATTDTATITSWFTQLYRNHGVGLAMGPGSGVWCLDVDVSDGKDGEASYEALIGEIGDLPPTVTAVTGSGGFHYLFKWPTDGTDIRNDQSGKLGAGLDIRGDGGQIVAAPTIHKDTKVAYRWVTGAGPDDIEVADTPPALLEKLRQVTERAAPPKAPTPPPRITSTGDDDDGTPAEWVNSHTTWDHLLTTDGWTLVRTLANGEQRWRRPGKNDGMSATVGHDGRDVLKVFTSSVAALEADKAYSRFGYVAATRHAGDRSACARSVRKDMPTVEYQGIENGLWNPPAVELEPVDEPEHGWTKSDMVAVGAADYEPTRPTVLARDDGQALFYPERINALWGESGSCKSWLAQYTITQGHVTLYIDHEDTARAQYERQMMMGMTPAQILRQLIHINPERAWNPAAQGYIRALVADHGITLAVIDSTGEAMASDGISPNADEEVARWHQELPKFLTRLGVTVILIDHIPKDVGSGKPNLFAIGSQRKRAAINGAAYMVEAKVSPAKGKDGHLVVTCAKDRHGTYSRGERVADVDVVSSNGGNTVQITVRHHEKVTRPTVLMGRVSEYLEQAGGWHSTEQIKRAVTGNNMALVTATTVLIQEGFVEQEQRHGKAAGFYHRSIKPFVDTEMTFAPVDNPGLGDSTSPTSPQPLPNPSLGELGGVNSTSPTSPTSPISRGGGEGEVNHRPEGEVAAHSAPVDNDPPLVPDPDDDEDLDRVWFDDDDTPINPEETP